MSLLFNVLLFLIPLIYIPVILFPFELPKVIASEAVIFVMFFVWILSTSVKQEVRKNATVFFVVVPLFVLSLVGFFMQPNLLSFFGNPYRLQGVFLLWSMLVLLIVTVYSSQVRLNSIVWAISFVALLASTFVFKHPSTGRAVGTLGEANALSAAAVFLWPFSFLFEHKRIRRSGWYLSAVALIATGVIVFLSGSRAGIIALCIQLAYIVLRRFVKVPYVPLIIALLFIIGSLVLPFVDTQGVYENRAEIWKTAYSAGFKSPIIGQGFGNVQMAIRESALTIGNNIRFQVVDSSHNMFLDWWIEGGVIGVVLLTGIVLYTIFALERKKQQAYSVMFLGVVSVLLFNPASVVTLIAFWWLVGVSFKKDAHHSLF